MGAGEICMGIFETACVNKRLFFILFLASILANIAVLPYASSLGLVRIEELPIPFPIAILVVIIQASIVDREFELVKHE